MSLLRTISTNWIMSTISSYKDIIIRPNALYVFDIDDTLIHFPEFTRSWWKETTQKYKMVCEETADDNAHAEWIGAVEVRPGFACDKDGFKEVYTNILNVGGKVILLTARPEHMKTLTMRHLREGLWDFDAKHVHFDKEKGQRLRKILKDHYKDINQVIFVDDYDKNIESVRDAFSGSNISLDTYLYVHRS